MKKLLLSLLILSCIVSCKKDPAKQQAEQIVKEWMGKVVNFPPEIPCLYLGVDTICPSPLAMDYKILLYVDSTGCTSCKLKLYQWNEIIKEVKDSFPDKAGIFIYIQPKSKKELSFLLKREGLKYPIFFDEKDEIDKLNNFPDNASYQCFLLDKDNKVVLIGNPSNNTKIWKLYKEIITGKGMQNNSAEPQTTKSAIAVVREPTKELNDMKASETTEVIYVIENQGEIPLLISNIEASCGCTLPSWDKQPVKPNEKTEIKVRVTPDKSGYLNKTINVFCNSAQSPICLTVKGVVKE